MVPRCESRCYPFYSPVFTSLHWCGRMFSLLLLAFKKPNMTAGVMGEVDGCGEHSGDNLMSPGLLEG